MKIQAADAQTVIQAHVEAGSLKTPIEPAELFQCLDIPTIERGLKLYVDFEDKLAYLHEQIENVLATRQSISSKLFTVRV